MDIKQQIMMPLSQQSYIFWVTEMKYTEENAILWIKQKIIENLIMFHDDIGFLRKRSLKINP